MSVVFTQVTKAFGTEVAIGGLDLTVAPGSFTVITGPPKCGKSVLFRLLVGLETLDDGTIELDGVDISRMQPGQRKLGYVPQSFALYPNLNVRENIIYPLTLAKTTQAEIDRQLDRAVNMLSIRHLLDKTPDQLSGGEKQRTALARGLLKDANVFVLDDPLVGLDYKLRESLMEDLKKLRADIGATFIYATSDSVEALQLASDLVIMDIPGKILQHADPITTYRQPANARAMELLGFPRANLLPSKITGGKVVAGPLEIAVDYADQSDVTLGFRPEALQLSLASDGVGKVRLVEDIGSELIVYVDAGELSLTSVVSATAAKFALGDQVAISVASADVCLFDSHGALLQ